MYIADAISIRSPSWMKCLIIVLVSNVWHKSHLGNPWSCDNSIEWLRVWLRNNPDVKIDKPGTPQCVAACAKPDWLPPNWPIRDREPVTSSNVQRRTTTPQALPTPGIIVGAGAVQGLSATVWIILGEKVLVYSYKPQALSQIDFSSLKLRVICRQCQWYSCIGAEATKKLIGTLHCT